MKELFESITYLESKLISLTAYLKQLKDTNNRLILENKRLTNDNANLKNELRELKEGLEQNKLNKGNLNSGSPVIKRIDKMLIDLEWCIDHMDA